MTFWPRFAVSRNGIGNFVEIKNMFALRPAPSTEFQGGPCCSSQIDWGPNICKVLPGCITADSETPMDENVKANYTRIRSNLILTYLNVSFSIFLYIVGPRTQA